MFILPLFTFNARLREMAKNQKISSIFISNSKGSYCFSLLTPHTLLHSLIHRPAGKGLTQRYAAIIAR